MPPTRADAPRPRLGDRVEAALEQRADLAEELERGAAGEESASSRRSGALRRTAFWLVVTAVSLYLVAPAVIDVLGSWRQIVELPLAWLAVMAVAPGGRARMHCGGCSESRSTRPPGGP